MENTKTEEAYQHIIMTMRNKHEQEFMIGTLYMSIYTKL